MYRNAGQKMARVAKKSVGDANSKGKARAKAVSGQRKPNELNQEKLNKQKEKQSPKLTAPYFSLRNSIVRWALILLVLLVISVVVYSNHPIEGKNFLNNLSSLSFLNMVFITYNFSLKMHLSFQLHI